MLPRLDPLTGLPNKAFFEARLGVAIRWARRSGTGLAVLQVDLDHFKELNRVLGQGIGERLLCDAASRMSRALGPCVTLARIGDDEFGALIETGGGPSGAAAVARTLLAQYLDPYVYDCVSVPLTASIGISLYPRDAQDAVSLMKRADRALHRAKIDGRARSYPPC